MAKRNMKTCIVCGKEYEYCSGCAEYSNMAVWHNLYHDENCKNIFNIASNYHAGKLTQEQAKAEFDKCDLTNKKSFKSSIRELIEDLCKEEPVIIMGPIEIIESDDTVTEKVMKKRYKKNDIE